MSAMAASPYRGRWRRWAARAERYRVTYGRWLPFPPCEPCWERRPVRAAPVRAVLMGGPYVGEEDEGGLVRAYVTAYLGEGRTA